MGTPNTLGIVHGGTRRSEYVQCNGIWHHMQLLCWEPCRLHLCAAKAINIVICKAREPRLHLVSGDHACNELFWRTNLVASNQIRDLNLYVLHHSLRTHAQMHKHTKNHNTCNGLSFCFVDIACVYAHNIIISELRSRELSSKIERIVVDLDRPARAACQHWLHFIIYDTCLWLIAGTTRCTHGH